LAIIDRNGISELLPDCRPPNRTAKKLLPEGHDSLAHASIEAAAHGVDAIVHAVNPSG
jgi:hypothetical protein